MKKTKSKSLKFTKTDKALSEILIKSGAVTIGELIEVFKKSTIDREYSGQFRIRIPKTLHKELVISAKAQGMSLNSYVLYVLSKFIRGV